MGKIAPGAIIPVRNMPTISVEDNELPPAHNYVIVALSRIQKILAGLSRQLENRTKLVDEYSIVQEYIANSVASVEVLPTFDTINEKIESVIVTGPPATAFTLQLGDRFWSVLTDSSGRFTLSSVAILLGRNDRRILTGQSAGNWTLELMGIADERY